MEHLTLPLCAPRPLLFKAAPSRESDPIIYKKGHSPDQRQLGCGSGAVSEQPALGCISAGDESGSSNTKVQTPEVMATILGIPPQNKGHTLHGDGCILF